jgi:hypothetical protein
MTAASREDSLVSGDMLVSISGNWGQSTAAAASFACEAAVRVFFTETGFFRRRGFGPALANSKAGTSALRTSVSREAGLLEVLRAGRATFANVCKQQIQEGFPPL